MATYLPRWYLWLAAVLVSYGWFSAFYLRFSHNIVVIHKMNLVNLGITLFWIVLNLGMIGWLFYKRLGDFPWEEKVIPFYYFTLNVLNAFNIQYGIITDFQVLFFIALITKTLESFVLSRLLFFKSFY